jgi:hypothetical protein
MTPDIQEKFRAGVKDGFRKGFSGFFWMLKIIVPVSFFTMLVEWGGIVDRFDFLFAPLMGWMHLPAEAALPILAGILTGVYGGIAAMAVLSLTVDQMTLIAVFLLISHALIQEGIIQGKSGIHPLKITAVRLAASFLTTAALGFFLKPVPAAFVSSGRLAAETAFLPVLSHWFLSTAGLCVQIFAIIMVLMLLLGIMKQFHWIPRIIGKFHWLLRALGLSDRVGMLWLTAGIFGISYGAAVIVEETREGGYPPEELEYLHISIGINHAMVEDPMLFLPLGLNPFWLWVPRILVALTVVQAWRWVRGIYRPAVPESRPGSKISDNR